MPDISMCEGGNCPKKQECYRYTAAPGYRQAYTTFWEDYQNCNNFMSNKNRSNKRITLEEYLIYRALKESEAE